MILKALNLHRKWQCSHWALFGPAIFLKKFFKSDDFPLTSWLRMHKYDVGFTVVCT